MTAIPDSALVRRFTDELNGDTTLERATILAQQEQDAIEEAEHKARLRLYFERPSSEERSSWFHGAETARLALEKTCTSLFATEKKSILTKLGLSRKASRVAANEIMQQFVASDFTELRGVVEGLESGWKQKQSQAFGQFRRLCRSLDAHKKIFALVPSQNNYASTLCGGLTLIIGAAVNHDEIAETLSEKVAEIAEQAARVAKFVDVIETQEMSYLLAELYAQVFLFYRDAIAWYMKPKFGRFVASFNEQVKPGYEKAVAKIRACIQEMIVESNVAGVAIMKTLLYDHRQLRRNAEQHRQEARQRSSLAEPGYDMRNLMFAILQNTTSITATTESKKKQGPAQVVTTIPTERSTDADRATVQAHLLQQQMIIVGDEGQSLFRDGRFWLPDVDVSPKLNGWMDRDMPRSRLWVSSPVSSREVSGARATAMVALVAAWESEEPIVSHFCERPKVTDVPAGRKVENVGMIGLIYSLILQLLQFCPEVDPFRMPHAQLQDLDGSDESWDVALRTLSALLQVTPELSVCVIDGLNLLSLSTGAAWCAELLDVLFEHQQSSTNDFRLLITTSGASKVISEYFEREERVHTNSGAREIARGGK